MTNTENQKNEKLDSEQNSVKRKLSFFLPMIPPTITAQQKKINTKTKKIYDTMDLKQAKSKLEAHLSKHIPEVPFSGATSLTAIWLFPVRKGHYNGEFRISRPDTDNLNKALKDVMQKLNFFTNDSVVAVEYIEKRWADKTGIYIELQDITQENISKKSKKSKGGDVEDGQ